MWKIRHWARESNPGHARCKASKACGTCLNHWAISSAPIILRIQSDAGDKIAVPAVHTLARPIQHLKQNHIEYKTILSEAIKDFDIYLEVQ